MGRINKLEVGVVIGSVVISTGLLFAISITPPRINKVQVFQRGEEKPAVMRFYRTGLDEIYVENPEGNGEYIRMSQYLSGIKDEAKRKIEEAQIEKAVKWYEE